MRCIFRWCPRKAGGGDLRAVLLEEGHLLTPRWVITAPAAELPGLPPTGRKPTQRHARWPRRVVQWRWA
jgi:hypothetical protein